MSSLGSALGLPFDRTPSGGWLPVDPGDISTEAWYDASDTGTIVSAANAVESIADKSGNARTLSYPGISAFKPSTGISSKNGLNVLTFDGADFLIGVTASHWRFLHQSPGCAGWVVYKRTLLGADGAIMGTQFVGNANGFDLKYMNTPGSLRHRIQTNDATASVDNQAANGVGGTLSTWYMASFRSQPAHGTAGERSHLHVNNGVAQKNNAQTNAPSSGVDPEGPFVMGGAWNQGQFGGDIGEIVLVSSYPSDADFYGVGVYMLNKWAIS